MAALEEMTKRCSLILLRTVLSLGHAPWHFYPLELEADNLPVAPDKNVAL